MRAKWVAVAVAGAGAAYAAERARRAREPARVEPVETELPSVEPVETEPPSVEPVETIATAPAPVEPVETAPAVTPLVADVPPTAAVAVTRVVPEPIEEPADGPEDEPEDGPSTKVALSGFYVGLVCMLFAPLLYFSATDWLFEAETSAQLTPFVLLLLAVPAILVAVPRTRRFGLYMVLGLVLTGVVVATTAIVVLFLLFRTG